MRAREQLYQNSFTSFLLLALLCFEVNICTLERLESGGNYSPKKLATKKAFCHHQSWLKSLLKRCGDSRHFVVFQQL